MRSILTLTQSKVDQIYKLQDYFFLKDYFRWIQHHCLFVYLLLTATDKTGGVVPKSEI